MTRLARLVAVLATVLALQATAEASTTSSVQVTYYGAYDNDPPGSTAIAHPVLHSGAGGTGTYADPLTFASPAGAGAYPWGTIIYVPIVQKYFLREDECATSWTAPNGCGAVSHVDLYVGNPSTDRAVVACENALTTDDNQTIIVDPAPDLTYDATTIWNQATGACMKPHSTATPDPSSQPSPTRPSGRPRHSQRRRRR